MKNKGMYTRIGQSDPVGVSRRKGLLPPLLKILASLSLLTTIIFLVWGWRHLSSGQEWKGNPIVIPTPEILSGPNNNASPPIMNDFEDNELDSVFTERKEDIRKTCQSRMPKQIQRNKAGMDRRNWIFIKPATIGRSMSIEWCPIYKAASSPWMAIFGKLASVLTPHTEEMIHAGKYTFIKLFKDFRLNLPERGTGSGGPPSVKMLIVRHPFQRLLSAYRDKLERVQGRDFYFRKYGHRILAQFRYANQSKSNQTNQNLRLEDPVDTFRSTLSKVLEIRDVVKILRENGTLSSHSLQRPTFHEFVQYLLTVDVRSMDEHWRPMWLDCPPCQYPFDLILKVETMERDRGVIFNLLGFGPNGTNWEMAAEMNQIWNRWTNKGKPYDPHKDTREDERQSLGKDARDIYFSQIPQLDLKRLYLKYEMDFQLFNYSPDIYFAMGS